jgi:methylenetetrahydrofolate dehydrogenase (NADP+)/methenyltetrahydrofolate cyclohydrolase
MEKYNLIDGKKISSEMIDSISRNIQITNSKLNFVPGLAVILIGNDPASKVYVANKERSSKLAGMNSWVYNFPEKTTRKEIINKINILNNDELVDGILVQLPFPSSSDLSERDIISFIDPKKDVDGLHISNIGKLANGEEGIFPATPSGCMILIKKYSENLSGKKSLIIGRSNLVGKPIATMLLNENCTVTIAHSKTNNLISECKNSDIIIAAAGKPNFIKGSWIKKGSIIIDVGINRITEPSSKKSYLTGDVEFNEAKKIAKAITPVPGGVGPMTIACLLLNTFKAAHMRRNIEIPEIIY